MRANLEAWRRGASCKSIKVRRRAHEFLPSALGEGRLVQKIENEAVNETVLQLRIPHDRATGWKTVALALLTYRQIDCRAWHYLASLDDSLDIAGFDWAELKLNDNSVVSEGPGASE